MGSSKFTNQEIWMYKGCTKSHEQLFFACKLGTADKGEYSGRWNQLLCYPWVSCDVNSLHHVTSITPNKMAVNDVVSPACCHQISLKRKSLLQKFTRGFSVFMEVCGWVWAVFRDGWNILKMGTRASKISFGVVALEQS